MSDGGKRLELGYLYGGEVVYQAGEALKPRLLTDYELVYLVSGDVSYTAETETYTVPAGRNDPGPRWRHGGNTGGIPRNPPGMLTSILPSTDFPRIGRIPTRGRA